MNGRQAEVGVVLPSNNTVLAPELQRMLPTGVSARFREITAVGADAGSLVQMSDTAGAAIDALAADGADVLIYACLSTSLARGTAWDRAFAAEALARTGLRCLTAAHATVQALAALGAQRVGLVSPYPPDIDRLLPGFFGEHGIEVTAHASLGISDIHDVPRRDPEETRSLAKTLAGTFDAVAIVATDLRTVEIVDALETDLDVPVVTTNQALVWRALSALGRHERRRGHGALLAQLPPAHDAAGAAR